MMRMMLYEAAQSMLVRSTKWTWLKAWAMKIARHRGTAWEQYRINQGASRESAPAIEVPDQAPPDESTGPSLQLSHLLTIYTDGIANIARGPGIVRMHLIRSDPAMGVK